MCASFGENCTQFELMVQELWREEFHAKNQQILSRTLPASTYDFRLQTNHEALGVLPTTVSLLQSTVFGMTTYCMMVKNEAKCTLKQGRWAWPKCTLDAT